jgi:AcrR family transcriptional regulator
VTNPIPLSIQVPRNNARHAKISTNSLFEDKGYEKATMRELAARAEVGIGTIFQHFSSKPALLIATFDEEMRPVVENAISTIPATNLKEQLLHLMRHVFVFYARRIRLSRVLLKEILFMEGVGAENIKQMETEYLSKLEALFTEAVSRGEIQKSIHIPDAVAAFWSYYSYTLLEGLNASSFDIERQVARLSRLIDQLFSGIGVSSK